MENRESVKSKSSLEPKKSEAKSSMSDKRKSDKSIRKESIVEK